MAGEILDKTPSPVEQHQQPEVAGSSPWADSPFGASIVGGTEAARFEQTGFAPELTKIVDTPTLEKPPEDGPREKSAAQVKAERKETINEAAFEVRLNRQAIANILRDNPHFVKDDEFSERATAEANERREDLQRTLDTVARLPEVLDFKPGITLIVGENGIGKSTLARALQLAGKIRDWSDDETSPEVGIEEAKDLVFNPHGFNIGNPHMNTLAPHVANLITVDKLATVGSPYSYYDSSSMMGARNQQELEYQHGEHRAGGRHWQIKDTDLTIGRSHRQTIDFDLWYALERDKKDYEKKKGKKLNGFRDVGPQLYFIDEPEVGMSPKRHRDIERQLEGVIIENSIAIIPTNSIVLYETDLPRIDLEHPEWGIFRPSEHPGYFEEDFEQAA